MKKNYTQAPNTEIDRKENPPCYKIDHEMAVIIWKSLFESGDEELAQKLSKTMIEQGCQEVEVDDASLMLMFWKDYLEDKGIISFTLEDKIVH